MFEFPVKFLVQPKIRPKIPGSNQVLDRVQTEPGRNPFRQDFNEFRFGSGQIPGLDRKFPVQTGFWTESKPNLVEILSGRILTSLGLAPVEFPV
jgi:hypothetical protein